MTMSATVMAVQEGNLLVFDHKTSQEVIVHTADAHRFRRGQRVCIGYSGVMTRSLPPQISAIFITRFPLCG